MTQESRYTIAGAYNRDDCPGDLTGSHDTLPFIFTENEMLEQVFCILKDRGETKRELVNILKGSIEEYREKNKFIRTQMLFSRMIESLDYLLEKGVKQGVFEKN